MRSEKDLPCPHWFSVLENNLWVGAPLLKAWKLGSNNSEDEWEEGAHQRAEPSGWAHIRSFVNWCKTIFIAFPIAKWTSAFLISLCIFYFKLGYNFIVPWSGVCRIMSPSAANLKFMGYFLTVKRKQISFFLLFYFSQGIFYYPESDVGIALSHFIGFN